MKPLSNREGTHENGNQIEHPTITLESPFQISTRFVEEKHALDLSTIDRTTSAQRTTRRYRLLRSRHTELARSKQSRSSSNTECRSYTSRPMADRFASQQRSNWPEHPAAITCWTQRFRSNCLSNPWKQLVQQCFPWLRDSATQYSAPNRQLR